MYRVGIFTKATGWAAWTVSDAEAAYHAYQKACELCEAIGAENAAIWDPLTDEVIADWAHRAE